MEDQITRLKLLKRQMRVRPGELSLFTLLKERVLYAASKPTARRFAEESASA